MFLDKLRLPYREETAFGLLALCIFFVPLIFSLYSFENFESVKFSLFLMLTGASGALFFLKQKIVSNILVFKKGWLIFLGLFNFWALISAILSQDKIYAFLGFYYRYTSGMVFYVALTLFIILLINFLDSGKLIYLLKIFVIDALAVAVVTYLQSFGWLFYAGDPGGLFRGPSLLGNSNYSAMFLAVALPSCIYFFKVAQSKLAKIYYAITAFSIIFAVLILASRGALLAVVASAVVALIFLGFFGAEKKIFWKLFSGFIVVLGIGFLLLAVIRPQALSSIASNVDANTTTRLYAWNVSFNQILKHPWFGSGPGNFALVFERSRGADLAGANGVFDDAHNLYLQLAVTGGIPLLLLFILGLLYCCFYAFKSFYLQKDLLALTLVSSLVAFVVAVSFNPVPIPMYMYMAVILVGILLTGQATSTMKYEFWKKIGLIFFCLVIFVWGAINLTSEHLLGLAKIYYQSENYSQSYKLANWSYNLNPSNGWSLVYRAYSNISLGINNQLAENDINKIKSLHPTQANSYVVASDLYLALFEKKYEKVYLLSAIASMQSAINIDAFFPERYGQLALDYYQLGDNKMAEVNAKKALALDGGVFPAWILLAKLYQTEGQKQQVVFALTQAFNLQPNIVQLKYLLNMAKSAMDIKTVPIQVLARRPSAQ